MLSNSIARKIWSYATNEPIDTNIHEYKGNRLYFRTVQYTLFRFFFDQSQLFLLSITF